MSGIPPPSMPSGDGLSIGGRKTPPLVPQERQMIPIKKEPCDGKGPQEHGIRAKDGQGGERRKERDWDGDDAGAERLKKLARFREGDDPVVYETGVIGQVLVKLWKHYESSLSSRAHPNSESSQQKTPILQIGIPAQFISVNNRQVSANQLWGTDVYTDDSDLVAVLMHTGYCRPTASLPPPALQELRVTVRLLPSQNCYTSTLRNNIRSRAWGSSSCCSYCVEQCCIVMRDGSAIDLKPHLTYISFVQPTLAPVVAEPTTPSRAAASKTQRQQRSVGTIPILYNFCNEPWKKYSLSAVADSGFEKPLYTSARLIKGEVLYLESHSHRYELCFAGEAIVEAVALSQTQDADGENERERESGALLEREPVTFACFRWSRCKKALLQDLMLSLGIPLPLEHVEVMNENLDWEQIKWSHTSVFIAGKEYALARLHFMSPKKKLE